ncbi:MAG: arginine--tRNA ligase [Firmicutes bacterium]|nr:arginine--tRNA ligase [Bacillota bacterium]
MAYAPQDPVRAALWDGLVQAIGHQQWPIPEAMTLTPPPQEEQGDYATNAALLLARELRQPPMEIAQRLATALDRRSLGLASVEVAPPGFINLRLLPQTFTSALPGVLAKGEAYGQVDLGQGERINVEFVSANPTGDLHVGHARWAAVGDSLCNLLAFAGYDVTREYYINDAGRQIDLMADSLEARYRQLLGQSAEIPPDGYHGEDLRALAQELIDRQGDVLLAEDPHVRHDFFKAWGLQRKMAVIREDLEALGVHFDVWFSERSLYEGKEVEAALDQLRRRGALYEQDQAVWLRTTAYGDDKDRVVIKSDGSYTYFAPDIAYHRNKLERGYDRLIDIFGADHHGYVPRLRAAIAALGYDAQRLEVLIGQVVRLFQDGQEVKMSKRTGRLVTLRELTELVGKESARYFLTMRSINTALDFDLDLARTQSNANPVYYVQYAHARIASLLRQAEQSGETFHASQADWSLLGEGNALAVVKAVLTYPDVIAEAARARAPHRLNAYLYELAGVFHAFYNQNRILGQALPLTQARLGLSILVGQILRSGLRILGITAPEQM